MLSFLALGWAAPRFARRGWSTLGLVKAGTALLLLIQLAIAFASGPFAWLLWLGLSAVVTVHTLAQTHVSLSFPERLTGRAYTAYNQVFFAGLFLAQWLFGVLVDAMGGTGDGGESFRRAMIVWVGIESTAFMLLVFWRVGPPRHEA